MVNTAPNKETIRRLCLLHEVKSCYLLSDTNSIFVDVLVDIGNQKSELFCQELESWCGMRFKIFTLDSDEVQIIRMKKYGEIIYPLMG